MELAELYNWQTTKSELAINC